MTTEVTTDVPEEVGAPLCVGLTGGLLPNDLAHEAALSLLKGRPSLLLRMPAWRMRGRMSFLRQVTRRIGPEPENLPYDEVRLRYLEEERARGRPLVLVSDEDPAWVQAVADHLGIFDEVVAPRVGTSRDVTGLLEDRYGKGGFDFVAGDGHPAGMDAAARMVLDPPRKGRRSFGILLARALRVHQWLKNLLIFLPVLAGQRFTDGESVLRATLAFVAFSLVASSVYVINDVLDLREDRKHHSKRRRPFASGDLPLRLAPFLLGGLLVTAAIITLFLPLAFSGVLAGYLALTFAYSLKLKGAVLVDVITLAGLYVVRVIAGSAATGIEPSVWLLGFSLFFFLSLAMVKRYAELHRKVGNGDGLEDGYIPGRSYQPGDLPVLIGLGTGTGCMSVLVLALYVISDEFALHYSYPFLLWLLCPLLLYWLGRAWIVVSRDEMADDPVVWAVRDQLSRWVAFLAVLILILAQ